MARANRHHLHCYVWHITHRCHKRELLLKFEKDKKRWVSWLLESKKRFGLCVLNYADMPIILCTGCSDKPDGNSPVDSGIQEIVMRPIRQVDPIRTVRSGLDEAASSM